MDKAGKAQLKHIRYLLRDKKARDEDGVFVAEGVKMVREILAAELGAVSVLFSSKIIGAPFFRGIEELCGRRGTPFCRVPAAEFEKLSSLRNSQGMLAVVRKPVPAVFPDNMARGPVMVLCDGVQDPGNLGAIIRTSAAFAAGCVLLFGDTADMYNPKAVRASSGAVLTVPVLSCDVTLIERLKSNGCLLAGATARQSGARSIEEIASVLSPLIIAFGSEGRGLSKEIENRLDMLFHIPVTGRVDSLNVTSAAAIALYVMCRERTGRGM